MGFALAFSCDRALAFLQVPIPDLAATLISGATAATTVVADAGAIAGATAAGATLQSSEATAAVVAPRSSARVLSVGVVRWCLLVLLMIGHSQKCLERNFAWSDQVGWFSLASPHTSHVANMSTVKIYHPSSYKPPPRSHNPLDSSVARIADCEPR